jgi:hypothetical protein
MTSVLFLCMCEELGVSPLHVCLSLLLCSLYIVNGCVCVGLRVRVRVQILYLHMHVRMCPLHICLYNNIGD